MLPRTTQLLTSISFFSVMIKVALASPVYNMQPAYITATIGSTGRNIRNLPCISRKNNQSGVCMFAIDCLKSNGTHLGTCIDRFYFGSCCHIEPLQDITENSIDAALIPAREPPHRITTPSATWPSNSTASLSSPTTVEPTTAIRNASYIMSQTTRNSTPVANTPSTLSDGNYKITTFQMVTHVAASAASTITKQPATVSKLTRKTPATTPIPKVTTRISTKITKPRPQTTPKQRPTYVNVTVTRSKLKPTKPVKVTKPTPNVTQLQALGGSTPQTIVTLRTTATSSKPVKITKKPAPSDSTTKKPIHTHATRLPLISSTMKSTTPTISATIHHSTVSSPKTFTLSNDVPTNAPQVTGNPINNEIESPAVAVTTSAPNLVTWSEINKNYSIVSSSTTTETTIGSMASVTSHMESILPVSTAVAGSNNADGDVTRTPDDWVPVTDGWVLLPSLTTTTEADVTTLSGSSGTTSEDIVKQSSTSLSTSTETGSERTPSTAIGITSSFSSSFGSVTPHTSTESTEASSVTSSPEPAIDANATKTSAITTAVPTTMPPVGGVPPVASSGINMSDFTDVCGRRMVPEGRIVGGEKSAFGKWPWQISLRQWRTSTYLHKCGAALLNENWAITAAHCVDNVPPSDLLLRLGEHDLSTESEPYLHQERRVQIVASHPQFDPRTFEYDLALLRFYEPVTFQPNIIPVCVPQTDENFVGRNAFVTGWGRLYEDGPLPSVLQEVSVPVINNTVCESMYRSAGYIEHIPNIFICAGWRRGGFDSCEGDSGGPMVIQRPDKRFILAGVISWGIGCAEPNQPGVYTRISEFRDWINQILQF